MDGKVETHYEFCWRKSSLPASAVRAAFLSLRVGLEADGAEFDHAFDAEDDGARFRLSDEADSDSTQSYSSSADEGLEGWPLVATLGWALRSDRTIRDADVRRRLGGLDAGARARLNAWMEAQIAKLAEDPYIATKGRELRLQFVALGEKWISTLRDAPELADYLEAETQPADLGDCLSTTNLQL
jgi:hypothetical protein